MPPAVPPEPEPPDPDPIEAEAVEPGPDADLRALVAEIEGPAAAPAPAARPRAVPVAAAVAAAAVACPRCGETAVPVANCCPWCGKWLVGPPPAPPRESAPEPDPEDDWHDDRAAERYERYEPPAARRGPAPLVVVFAAYGLLIVSLLGFAVLSVAAGFESEAELHTGLFAVSLFNALLTAGALALVWGPAQQPAPGRARLPAWALAGPALAALLVLNLGYITFLREALRPFGVAQGEALRLTAVTVLLVCAAPAVVEEVFFRQMMLGVFRRSMGLHTSVWLTALLFAVAHLGNPLGMPYLFLAGAAFGYARACGGLSLAVLAHFAHNFAVVAYESWR